MLVLLVLVLKCIRKIFLKCFEHKFCIYLNFLFSILFTTYLHSLTVYILLVLIFAFIHSQIRFVLNCLWFKVIFFYYIYLHLYTFTSTWEFSLTSFLKRNTNKLLFAINICLLCGTNTVMVYLYVYLVNFWFFFYRQVKLNLFT